MDPKMLSHVMKIRSSVRTKNLAQRWPAYALESSSRSQTSDADLVFAIAKGNRRALDRMQSAYQRQVVRSARLRNDDLLTNDAPTNNYFAVLARRAFLSLPKGRRNLIGLLHVLELSQSEAAESLGCALGTVKSRSSRFMDDLRALNISARPAARRSTSRRFEPSENAA